MSDLAHPPGSLRLQLYATSDYACSYLPGQQARSQVVLPHQAIDSAVYAQLLAQGFRRSGMHCYRPWCDGCAACISLRVSVQDFVPSRSQRRASRQHAGLTVRILPLHFQPEHYALYRSYQAWRHHDGSMAGDSEEDYHAFILSSLVDAVLVEFRLHGVLKMVALMDVLPGALSAVYTFYADGAHAAYGTYAVLWQIGFARKTGREHVYLGYWIADSAKMHYKVRFQPCEVFRAGRWQALDAQ